MKYTIESALRKVKRGHGIGAYGAQDFLRSKGIADTKVSRAAAPLPPIEGLHYRAQSKGEPSRVTILPNDQQCLRYAY